MVTQSMSMRTELDRYTARIDRYPILSPEEEIRLATRFRATGDLQAAQTLVTSNLRFVVKIAHGYRGYGVGLLDLIQEGNIGLMRAVRRFDPHRGYRLLSYAVHWIRAEMNTFLMRTIGAMKLGTARSHRKLFFKLRALKSALAAQGIVDHDEAVQRISETTGVAEQEVAAMEKQLCIKTVSLDSPIGDTGGALLETVPSDTVNQEDMVIALETETEQSSRLNAALSMLQENERRVIESRYLADTPKRLRDIGKDLGVSKQRVAQLEQRALRKLHDNTREALRDAA